MDSRSGDVPITLIAGDDASALPVIDPVTGAIVPVAGGFGMGLQHEWYGRAAWAVSRSAVATKILRALEHSKGLALTLLQLPESALNSPHGPMFYQAALAELVRRGLLSRSDALSWVNHALAVIGQSGISELHQLRHVAFALTFKQRGVLKRALGDLRRAASVGLPTWLEVAHAMQNPHINGGKGSTTSLLYPDPLSDRMGMDLVPHPGYRIPLAGVSFGLTESLPFSYVTEKMFPELLRMGKTEAQIYRQAQLKNGPHSIPPELLQRLAGSTQAYPTIDPRLVARGIVNLIRRDN